MVVTDSKGSSSLAYISSIFVALGVCYLHIWRAKGKLIKGRDGVSFAKEAQSIARSRQMGHLKSYPWMAVWHWSPYGAACSAERGGSLRSLLEAHKSDGTRLVYKARMCTSSINNT